MRAAPLLFIALERLPCRGGAAARPRARGDPPRHQAREHHAPPLGSTQGDGLRPRQGGVRAPDGGRPVLRHSPLAALGLALGGLAWSRLPPPPSPSPFFPALPANAAPSAPLPTAEPTPVLSPPPARIVVDFRHPLEAGRLRVWLDGEELPVERLSGDVTRNLVLFKLKGGVLTEVLEVMPGRHRFRVEVSWDDERRDTETFGLREQPAPRPRDHDVTKGPRPTTRTRSLPGAL